MLLSKNMFRDNKNTQNIEFEHDTTISCMAEYEDWMGLGTENYCNISNDVVKVSDFIKQERDLDSPLEESSGISQNLKNKEEICSDPKSKTLNLTSGHDSINIDSDISSIHSLHQLILIQISQ